MPPAPESGPQVGLVVVTHGSSGACLLTAAAGLVGPLPASTSVSVELTDRFDDIVRQVERACHEVDSGAGLLILADIHGASPFRACLAMFDGTRSVEIVCGVNLPMLIKLATVSRRGMGPGEIAEIIKEVGKRSIRLGSELTGKIALPREEHH
jgi:mannose/fructose-specific phosphotransferase system component IIA